MIIGFLGKGGSGKSTMSAAFCEYLLSQNKTVLAVDADHNMDLLFNLHVEEKPNWLGDSMNDLLKFGGVDSSGGGYRQFFEMTEKPEFRLSPMDEFTSKYSREARAGLHIMAGGPHTDEVLHDKACSHVLTTPLKVLLPFFKLQEDEFIVVDEKAGSDGAGTGVASGLDLGVIVLEGSPHGVKAAQQIAELLDFFGTPYAFLLNKVSNPEVIEKVTERLPKAPLMTFNFDEGIGWDDTTEGPRWDFAPLLTFAAASNESTEELRQQRALGRIEKNKEFAARA